MPLSKGPPKAPSLPTAVPDIPPIQTITISKSAGLKSKPNPFKKILTRRRPPSSLRKDTYTIATPTYTYPTPTPQVHAYPLPDDEPVLKIADLLLYCCLPNQLLDLFSAASQTSLLLSQKTLLSDRVSIAKIKAHLLKQNYETAADAASELLEKNDRLCEVWLLLAEAEFRQAVGFRKSGGQGDFAALSAEGRAKEALEQALGFFPSVAGASGLEEMLAELKMEKPDNRNEEDGGDGESAGGEGEGNAEGGAAEGELQALLRSSVELLTSRRVVGGDVVFADPVLWHRLAKVAVFEKNWRGALRYSLRSCELLPTSETFVIAGTAAYELGEVGSSPFLVCRRC